MRASSTWVRNPEPAPKIFAPNKSAETERKLANQLGFKRATGSCGYKLHRTFADACFSGSLFNETNRGYAENVEKYRSRWGLVSGRLEVVSDGATGENSPFAKHFIGYLNDNEKEMFTVSELVQFVKIEVANESDQTPLGNPIKSGSYM